MMGARVADIFASAPAQFLFILLAEAVVIWLVFWILRSRGLNFASIGFGRRPKWRDLGIAFIAYAAFFLLIAVLFAALIALVPELKPKLEQPQDVGFQFLASPMDRILAFLALVVLAPIGEEILVRGYMFSALRSRWRFLPAAIVTSIVFGAAHLQPETTGALVWGAALATTVLSLVLVYLRERTGALYSGILVHAFNNLLAFTVYFHAIGF